MPGIKPQTNGLQQTDKVTLRIVEGSFVQPVKEDGPGVQARSWEVNGKKGISYEIPWESWGGMVVDVRFNDSEFGKTCVVELEDAVIYLKTKSKYFRSLAERLMACDLDKPVELRPYDFESDDGKRLTGVSVKQDDEKVMSHYFDAFEKKSKNNMPQPEDEKKNDDGYWSYYFAQVSSFLVKELEGLEFKRPEAMSAEEVEAMFED